MIENRRSVNYTYKKNTEIAALGSRLSIDGYPKDIMNLGFVKACVMDNQKRELEPAPP